MMWAVFLFGIGGILFNFAIYQQKTRKNLLCTKLIADCLWSLHYAFLGAWSGAAICSIGILRESIFLNERHKWAQGKRWLLLFGALSVLSAVITWKNLFSVLPTVASILSVYSFWKGDPKRTKILSLPISACFMTYNIVLGSYIGIINEIFVLISTIIALMKIYHTSKKQKNIRR